MGSKLKGTGVEFPDGTLQTTAARDFNVNYYDSDENLLANGVIGTLGINDKIETVSQYAISNYDFNINDDYWQEYHWTITQFRANSSYNVQYSPSQPYSGSSGLEDDTYKLQLTNFFYCQCAYTEINVPSHMVAGDTFRIMFDYVGDNTQASDDSWTRMLRMYIFSGDQPITEVTRSKNYTERYYQTYFNSSTIEDAYTFIYNNKDASGFFRNKISKKFELTQGMVDSGKIYLAFENDIYNMLYGMTYSNAALQSTKFNIDNLRFLEQDPSNTIDGDDTTFWSGSTDGNSSLGEAILYDSKTTEVVKGVTISPDPDTKRIKIYGTNTLADDSWYSSGMVEIADLTTDSTSFPNSQIYDSQSLISGTSRYNYVWALNNNSTAYQYYCVQFYAVNGSPVKIYEVTLHPKLLTSTYEYHLVSNDSADGVVFSKNLDQRVTTLENDISNINLQSIEWLSGFPTISHTPSTATDNWFQIDRNNHNGFNISNSLLYISTNYTWQTQDGGAFYMYVKYSPTVLSQSQLASYKTNDYIWQSFSVPNASTSNWASNSLGSDVRPFWITHTDLPSENPYSSRFIYIGFTWTYSVGFSQTDLDYRFVYQQR